MRVSEKRASGVTEQRYGGVAQLGEHLPCKQGVDSSILFISTRSGRIKRGRPKARIVGGSATEMGS